MINDFARFAHDGLLMNGISFDINGRLRGNLPSAETSARGVLAAVRFNWPAFWDEEPDMLSVKSMALGKVLQCLVFRSS